MALDSINYIGPSLATHEQSVTAAVTDSHHAAPGDLILFVQISNLDKIVNVRNGGLIFFLLFLEHFCNTFALFPADRGLDCC